MTNDFQTRDDSRDKIRRIFSRKIKSDRYWFDPTDSARRSMALLRNQLTRGYFLRDDDVVVFIISPHNTSCPRRATLILHHSEAAVSAERFAIRSTSLQPTSCSVFVPTVKLWAVDLGLEAWWFQRQASGWSKVHLQLLSSQIDPI